MELFNKKYCNFFYTQIQPVNKQNIDTAKTTAEVIKKLFKKDFLQFKESTIGKKIRDVTVEADHSTRSILNLLSICQDVIFLVLIVILIISTSPTISILIIGGLMIISALIFISYSAF